MHRSKTFSALFSEIQSTAFSGTVPGRRGFGILFVIGRSLSPSPAERIKTLRGLAIENIINYMTVNSASKIYLIPLSYL